MWKAEIENNPDAKAVVFSSAKPDMFIAGADIFDIKRVENKQDLVGLIKEGIDFFQHMRERNVPLVSAINGPCLGGGLEWAMWCDYRVCSNSPKTKVRRRIFFIIFIPFACIEKLNLTMFCPIVFYSVQLIQIQNSLVYQK